MSWKHWTFSPEPGPHGCLLPLAESGRRLLELIPKVAMCVAVLEPAKPWCVQELDHAFLCVVMCGFTAQVLQMGNHRKIKDLTVIPQGGHHGMGVQTQLPDTVLFPVSSARLHKVGSQVLFSASGKATQALSPAQGSHKPRSHWLWMPPAP